MTTQSTTTAEHEPRVALDLIVDSGGGKSVMLLAFSPQAAGILSTTRGLVKAFGAFLGDATTADAVVRRALLHGLRCRVDGQTISGFY
jgi:hypothetical protein